MNLGKRCSKQAVYSELLYHKKWYPRLKLSDMDGEVYEALELHDTFGPI